MSLVTSAVFHFKVPRECKHLKLMHVSCVKNRFNIFIIATLKALIWHSMRQVTTFP